MPSSQQCGRLQLQGCGQPPCSAERIEEKPASLGTQSQRQPREHQQEQHQRQRDSLDAGPSEFPHESTPWCDSARATCERAAAQKAKRSIGTGVTIPLPVWVLRWTQDSINAKMVFGHGGHAGASIYKLVHDLVSSRVTVDALPRLETFLDDGLLFSVSNRRLAALHMYQALRQHEVVLVPCRVYAASDPAHGPKYRARKTTTPALRNGLGLSLGKQEAWHLGSPLFQSASNCRDIDVGVASDDVGKSEPGPLLSDGRKSEVSREQGSAQRRQAEEERQKEKEVRQPDPDLVGKPSKAQQGAATLALPFATSLAGGTPAHRAVPRVVDSVRRHWTNATALVHFAHVGTLEAFLALGPRELCGLPVNKIDREFNSVVGAFGVFKDMPPAGVTNEIIKQDVNRLLTSLRD